MCPTFPMERERERGREREREKHCGEMFCFGYTVLVTSPVSEKQLLQDRLDLRSLLYYRVANFS